jgi:hypothetical protein
LKKRKMIESTSTRTRLKAKKKRRKISKTIKE